MKWDSNIMEDLIHVVQSDLGNNEFSELEIDGLLTRNIRMLNYLKLYFSNHNILDAHTLTHEIVEGLIVTLSGHLEALASVDYDEVLNDIEDTMSLVSHHYFTEINKTLEEETELGLHPELIFSKKQRDRIDEMSRLLSMFCTEFLNESYYDMSCDIVQRLFANGESGIERSQVKTWAAGIIHALCKANELIGNTMFSFISPGQIYEYFEVSNAAALKKSKQVSMLLNVYKDVSEWQGDPIDIFENMFDFSDGMNESFGLSDAGEDWTIAGLPEDAYEDYVEASEMIIDATLTQELESIQLVVKKALEKSRYVSMAYFYLALFDQKSMEDSIDYTNKGIHIIESIWDKKQAEERKGSYWTDPHTIPYMQLQKLKFELLVMTKQYDEALDLGDYLLELCPSDDVGTRFQLMPLFLITDNDKALEGMNQIFSKEIEFGWQYTLALYYFKKNQLEKAEKALKLGMRTNDHIANMLLVKEWDQSARTIDEHLHDENYDEAMVYVGITQTTWYNTKDGIRWLKATREGKPFMRAVR